MPFETIYLDSNVLISAFGRKEDPQSAALLLTIIEVVDNDRTPPFVTSELALSETLVRPFRENRQDEIRGFEALLTSRDWLSVAPVSRDVLRGAALLRSRHAHLKLPDAIHVATAILSGCNYFMTADMRLRDQYGPLQAAGHDEGVPRQVAVIRPAAEVFEDILSWLRA